MSKVIAIIDKPEDCQECKFGVCKYSLPLTTRSKGYYCQLQKPENRVVEGFAYDEEVHLQNCPLHNVPEKKEERYALIRRDPFGNVETYGESIIDSVAVGYNACIDEIMKGSEEVE